MMTTTLSCSLLLRVHLTHHLATMAPPRAPPNASLRRSWRSSSRQRRSLEANPAVVPPLSLRRNWRRRRICRQRRRAISFILRGATRRATKAYINGIQEYVLGCFETAVEAAVAYAKALAEQPEGRYRRGQRAEQREGRGQRAEEEQPEGRAEGPRPEGSPPWRQQFEMAAAGSKRSIPAPKRFSPPSISPKHRRGDLVR